MLRLVPLVLLIACTQEHSDVGITAEQTDYGSTRLEPPLLGSRDIFTYATAPTILEGWQVLGIYGDDVNYYSAMLKAPDQSLYTPSLKDDPEIAADLILIEIDSKGVVVKKQDSTYRIELP